jgi:site-specific DNA recombinase
MIRVVLASGSPYETGRLTFPAVHRVNPAQDTVKNIRTLTASRNPCGRVTAMARRDSRRPARAAVYARISLDRTGGGLGVDRQVEDCMRLVSSRGWTVVDVFTDNDISAFSGKTRPAYRNLVVAWHTDRLHRSPRELEEYIEVSERHDVDTVTVQAGELDLATASGRMVARMLGAAARHESEQKGERIRRARQQAAEAGQAHGPLGYGYATDRTIDPEQAAVIREISERVLLGEALYSIATDLNARGVPTPGRAAGGWRSVTIRQTIMRASLAGWREWRPGARGTRGGRGLGEFTAKGDWQSILSRETVEQVRAVLTDPGRWVARRRPRSLLTGTLLCGRPGCGAPLNSAIDNRWRSRRYVCTYQPGMEARGGLTIVADPVDAMISAAVVEVLAGSRLRAARQQQRRTDLSAAEQELLDARRDRDELAAQRARNEITPSEWATMRRVLTERIERAERTIAAAGLGLVALTGIPSGRRARTWWATASLEKRRTIVRTLIESVTIAPALAVTNKFDPVRVGEPVWRI